RDRRRDQPGRPAVPRLERPEIDAKTVEAEPPREEGDDAAGRHDIPAVEDVPPPPGHRRPPRPARKATPPQFVPDPSSLIEQPPSRGSGSLRRRATGASIAVQGAILPAT